MYLHKRVSCEATIHKLAQARLREIVSKIASPYLIHAKSLEGVLAITNTYGGSLSSVLYAAEGFLK